MGTCYRLIAPDARRILDLDKFYNRRSAYTALMDIAVYSERGCEITPAVLRQAARVASQEQPSDDEDADDIAYGAEKLLKAAVWMERVGSKLAYLVNDGSDWVEAMFPLSAEDERTMTRSQCWAHMYRYREWPEDDPHDEVLDSPATPE